MISAIRVTDPSRCCVVHWEKVAALKGLDRLEFKPGLNILWGPNGCGKSTVLTLLARMLHCEQGNRTVVTQTSVQAVFTVPYKNYPNGFRSEEFPDGVVPVHDGQATLHFDPGHAVGLIGGSFDWDFGTEGIHNAISRGSAGETSMRRMNDVLTHVVKPETFPRVEWKEQKPEGEPGPKEHSWTKKLRQVATFLDGTLERGQPTVLLDEPDRSLSIKLQAGLWHNLAARYAGNVQVIAASHSPFALRLPGAHYIDLSPGYLAECEGVIDTYLPSRLTQ